MDDMRSLNLHFLLKTILLCSTRVLHNMPRIFIIFALIASTFARNPGHAPVEVQETKTVFMTAQKTISSNQEYSSVSQMISKRTVINKSEANPRDNFAVPDDECDLDRYMKCAVDMLHALNITSMDPSEQFGQLLTQLQSKLGFQKYCRAENHFKKCVGPSLPKCIDAQSLQSKALYHALDEMCYDEAFDYHYECMLYTLQEYHEEVSQCNYDAAEIFLPQPEESGICRHVQDASKCLQKVFSKGCRPEFGESVCQLTFRMQKHLIPEAKCFAQCDQVDYTF